jgi:alkylation response protein AidB-like acyl-CoA dehydrogenase
MLIEMRRKIDRAEALSHHALDLLAAHKPCHTEVSLAKRLVCDDAVWIADRALQIHGGYGYSKEFVVERLYRDAPLLVIGEGTNEIQRLVIAKRLIEKNPI